VIYWPGKENLPIDLPVEIGCFCVLGNCDNIEWGGELVEDPVNVKYKQWKLNEVLSLGVSLVMYQNEIGRNALKSMMSGVVFIRGKGETAPIGKTAGGYYYDKDIHFNNTITLLDTDSGRLGHMVRVFVHEIAHHLTLDYADQLLGFDIVDSFRQDVWGGRQNPDSGPSKYARKKTTIVEEDLAETITAYMWERHSGVSTDNLSAFDALRHGNPGCIYNELDPDRLVWIEGYFDRIRALYP